MVVEFPEGRGGLGCFFPFFGESSSSASYPGSLELGPGKGSLGSRGDSAGERSGLGSMLVLKRIWDDWVSSVFPGVWGEEDRHVPWDMVPGVRWGAMSSTCD